MLAAIPTQASAGIIGPGSGVEDAVELAMRVGGIVHAQGRIDEAVRLAAEFCGPDGHPALPVAGMVGNGGSWFKLYLSEPYPKAGRLGPVWAVDAYVSWSLQTNNIVNGADGWAFGVDYGNGIPQKADLGLLEVPTWDFLFSTNQFGECQSIGSVVADDAYEYYVDAGAWGWQTATECTTSISWETSVGVTATIKGPEVEATVTMGAAYACTDGGVFDSESLLKGAGAASSRPCVDCILS